MFLFHLCKTPSIFSPGSTSYSSYFSVLDHRLIINCQFIVVTNRDITQKIENITNVFDVIINLEGFVEIGHTKDLIQLFLQDFVVDDDEIYSLIHTETNGHPRMILNILGYIIRNQIVISQKNPDQNNKTIKKQVVESEIKKYKEYMASFPKMS